MDKKVKYILTLFFVTMIGYASCTNEETDAIQYGSVNGTVSATFGQLQGFTVSLYEFDGTQPIRVVVTNQDGAFCFDKLAAGSYRINVQKENYECILMTVDSQMINRIYVDYNEYEIILKENQTVNVTYEMQPNSSYINDELKITDEIGNPINDSITILKNTQMVGIRLYNETTRDISWDISSGLPFLQGARDTIVGNYSGYTGYGTYRIFSEITPSSGKILPGENVLVTLTINQDIYDLDYFSRKYTTLTLSANNLTHYYSKKIELDLPFVNITDMSDWYDHK